MSFFKFSGEIFRVFIITYYHLQHHHNYHNKNCPKTINRFVEKNNEYFSSRCKNRKTTSFLFDFYKKSTISMDLQFYFYWMVSEGNCKMVYKGISKNASKVFNFFHTCQLSFSTKLPEVQAHWESIPLIPPQLGSSF